MKITDPDIIKIGESDLINAIKEKLDWDAIHDLNKKNTKSTGLECTKGDIVVHDNQVAYKLDFEIRTGFSVLFDREGNIIDSDMNIGNHLPDEPPLEVSADIDSPDISDDLLADFENEMEEVSPVQKDDYSLDASDLLEEMDDSKQSGLSDVLDLDGIPDDFDTTEASLEDVLTDDFPAPEVVEQSDGGGLVDDMDLSDLNELEDLDLPEGSTSLDDADIDALLALGEKETDDTDIDALLEEELKLPSDEALGVLEEKVDSTKSEIQDAMKKSQNFWNTAEDVSSPPPENDMLKRAMSQSQNFWTSGNENGSDSTSSLVDVSEAPQSPTKNILKKAFLKSQNFWLQK